jgi:hypothetical protein
MGWKQKSVTSGLLNDFLRLAYDTITVDVGVQVFQFVLKWGPLWLCRTDGHVQCHWSPGIGSVMSRGWPCGWAPTEEIEEFVRKAWEAKAVLEIAYALQNDHPIARGLWHRLGLPSPPEEPRQMLATFVDLYFFFVGGRGPLLVWKADTNPKLVLYNGLGFIHAIWMEIAQLLCHANGISQCDGCGAFYIREVRKEKAGQRNFCPRCREGNRGSKKIAAQRRRDRERKLKDASNGEGN